MGEKHNKKMAKKKQIKKIDDHFFSLKKQGKNWVEIKNLDWGKALYKKQYYFFRIFFFFFFWFYLTYHHNFLCFIIILSGLGIFEIRERFKLQKRKKFLDQKIYHSMI